MESARYFHQHHKELLKEATVIAEEVTSDFFKLSPCHWRRARYDILTLEALRAEEISSHALALVAKYDGRHQDRLLKSAGFDFYRICLQDHNILKALESGKLHLQPLLIYILIHELVHVVRSSRFLACFDASCYQRRREEGLVHQVTRQILGRHNSSDFHPVIRHYENDRQGGRQYAHI